MGPIHGDYCWFELPNFFSVTKSISCSRSVPPSSQNMGCYHDRDTVPDDEEDHDYAYGKRYCTGTNP